MTLFLSQRKTIHLKGFDPMTLNPNHVRVSLHGKRWKFACRPRVVLGFDSENAILFCLLVALLREAQFILHNLWNSTEISSSDTEVFKDKHGLPDLCCCYGSMCRSHCDGWFGHDVDRLRIGIRSGWTSGSDSGCCSPVIRGERGCGIFFFVGCQAIAMASPTP